MSLTALSPLAWWLGALALAGALFALQRLRVRHREVVVVTTMFWRDALEETRARTLVERFRHPLAYLLLLAIALLGWLSFAAPVATRDDGREHLFLLDLSAPMAVAGKLEDATAALLAEVRRTDRAHRRVVACGGGLATLLAPGEDELLLVERLATLAPEACAPSVERALVQLARPTDRDLAVRVFGAAGARGEVVALLAANVSVEFVEPRPRAGDGPVRRGAPGILAVSAGAAGRTTVDVWVDVAGSARTLVATRANSSLGPMRIESLGSDRERAVFEGLPGDGGLVEFELGAGTEPSNRAALVLPDLSPIRVALSARVPESLQLAVRAHPGVTVAETDVDVAVRMVGESVGGDVPALEVVAALDQDEAFVLVHEEVDDPRTLLFDALGDLGLEWIDAAGLAETAGRAIAFGERDGPRRGFVLWRELLEPPFEFANDGAFPLVVARAIEWLADRNEPLWSARAGEALADATRAYRAASGDALLDPVGAAFVAPRAGIYRAEGAKGAATGPVVLAIGPAHATDRNDLDVRRAASAPSSAFDLANLVLILLLALLVVEWSLVRRGRMP